MQMNQHNKRELAGKSPKNLLTKALLTALGCATVLMLTGGCSSLSSREPLSPYAYNPATGYPAVGYGTPQH
jgi:hypothetical protein